MNVQELNNLGSGFLIVEEPGYSREKLLEFQRKFGINTIVFFEYIDNFGITPVEINKKDLALWEHYFHIFIMAKGDSWDLLEHDEENLWGKALEEDTNPPLLFCSIPHAIFPAVKWCNTLACK